MLHYALYCLLTTCDILAMQALVWSRIFCFGASYANWKQPYILTRSEFMEETLSCIWVHMMYMICIILNNNGFAYPTFGESNFHNVLFSFRNESATQETTVCRVYCYISCVSMLKRFICMVTVFLRSGWISRNRYYHILFVRLVEDWLRSAVCIVPKWGR